MKRFTPSLKPLVLVLAAGAFTLTGALTLADRPESSPRRTEAIRAHAGTTFLLEPTAFDEQQRPVKFSHTVDGVARTTLLGNCTVHFEVIGIPQPDGTFALSGQTLLTSTDGLSTLVGDVEGVTSADDSGNPLFANFHYDVTFTAGSGRIEGVVGGKAGIDGLAEFAPDFSHGKATWSLQGAVIERRSRH